MLKTKFTDNLKAAMKEHDATAVSTLRMLLAAVQNKEIDKRGELADEEIVKLLLGEKKKHLESIQQFEAGERKDLAEKEKAELAVVEKYLPASMPEAELAKLVAAAAAEAAGPGDFGRVMKAVMASCGGRADGAAVSAMVRKALTKK